MACMFGCTSIEEDYEEYEIVYTARYYWYDTISEIIKINYEIQWGEEDD